VESVGATVSTCLNLQFMALTHPSDMEVKLTYVGLQKEPIETALFTSTVINLARLTFCRQPSAFYGNDLLGLRSFGATSQEMTSLLELAGQIPTVQYGPSRVQGQYLSLALFSPASGGPGIGYEVVLRPGDAGSLLSAVRAAIADNPTGLRTINELGCDIALPAPGTPTDVTTEFAVKFSSFLPHPASGLYVGTVTLSTCLEAAFRRRCRWSSMFLRTCLSSMPRVTLAKSLQSDDHFCHCPSAEESFRQARRSS
jgi:hypothetical protein